MENWKDIDGYEGYYQVSDMGKVRGLDRLVNKINGRTENRRGKTLAQISDQDEYQIVSLNKEGSGRLFKVHRLVASAFIPNPFHLPEVNHKKGNKKDNRAWELEWCTTKQNRKHAVETGLHCQGIKHPNSKPVKDNQTGEIYGSVKEAAQATGIPHSTLKGTLNGAVKKPNNRFGYYTINLAEWPKI